LQSLVNGVVETWGTRFKMIIGTRHSHGEAATTSEELDVVMRPPLGLAQE